MTINANAKLNLFLDILGKRDDGYHNITSIMQEIDLHDILDVELSNNLDICVSCDNSLIPTDNRNIAYRAAELFAKRLKRVSGYSFGVKIHIQKKIPVMAGLGGGSADAAAVLKALNRLHDDVFGKDALLEMGLELGADVPFCLTGGRAQCRGIGEIITPFADLPPQFYVIVQPDFYFDTKSAYERFSGVEGGFKPSEPFLNIFQQLYNDERIDGICDELLALGAKSASMTGSGSAVFGVFADMKSARAALPKLDYPFKCISRNVIRGVRV